MLSLVTGNQLKAVIPQPFPRAVTSRDSHWSRENTTTGQPKTPRRESRLAGRARR